MLESRRSTHNRIAELLQAAASSPGDLAVVAQHHDLAGDLAQAIPAYIAAAQAAQGAASHSEAWRLLDRTLELLESLPDDDERDLTELMVRMLRTISVSSLFGYGYPDVFEDFQLADRICRRLTDRSEIMPAQVGIWSYLLVRGEVDAAATVLEPLTSLLDAPETAWFTPEIKSCLGYSAFYQGRLEEARRWLEEAWAGYLARPTDASASPFWPLPHDPVPVTAVALACVAGLQGNTAESQEWERRALAAAEQLGFPFGPFSSAFVLTYLAWLRMITGDAEGARELGRRTLDIAEQCRFDYFSVIGRQYVLVPEPDVPGDPDELEQCEAGMDLIGHGAFRPAFLGIVARSHSYAGNHDGALERVGDALLVAQKSGERVHQPDLLRLRAEIIATAHPERMDEVVTDLDRRRRDRPGPGVPRAGPAGGERSGPTAGRCAQPRVAGGRAVGGRPLSPELDECRARRGAGPSSGAEMGSTGGRSVAMLGGGMGALVAAFELSEGRWTDRFDRITVYQRGWRLGGKGASSRGVHGRIEEHGLHVLLGYYDHTFDVMRRCYEELDRTRTDPSLPDPVMGGRGGAVEPGRGHGPGREWAGTRGWRPSAPRRDAQATRPVTTPSARRRCPPPSWRCAPSNSSSTSSRRCRGRPRATEVRCA